MMTVRITDATTKRTITTRKCFFIPIAHITRAKFCGCMRFCLFLHYFGTRRQSRIFPRLITCVLKSREMFAYLFDNNDTILLINGCVKAKNCRDLIANLSSGHRTASDAYYWAIGSHFIAMNTKY